MTATTRLPSPPPDKIETASVEHGTPRADLPDDLVLWRMSVKQYHAIAGAGIINEDEPVELVEGLLVDKMTKNPPHTFATQETRIALENLLPDGWFVNIQEPITLDTSEPELDISVIRGYRRDFRRHHPGPAATMLVVEVSNATLRTDLGAKKRIYARARIPVYWVINLIEMRIEVYTDPSGPARQPDYRTQQVFGLGDEIPVWLGDEEIGRISVQQLLPE